MFRKVASHLADPDLQNAQVAAISSFIFAAVAFLARARGDVVLTTTLATASTLGLVWASNQLLNGKGRNHQIFFQPVEHQPADLELGSFTHKKTC